MHRLDRTDRRVIGIAFIIALVFACAAAIVHQAGAQEPCTATAPELPTVRTVNQIPLATGHIAV